MGIECEKSHNWLSGTRGSPWYCSSPNLNAWDPREICKFQWSLKVLEPVAQRIRAEKFNVCSNSPFWNLLFYSVWSLNYPGWWVWALLSLLIQLWSFHPIGMPRNNVSSATQVPLSSWHIKWTITLRHGHQFWGKVLRTWVN